MPEQLMRLTDLTVSRVAFVPKGDNPEAALVVWKAAPDLGKRSDARRAKALGIGDGLDSAVGKEDRPRRDRLKDAWAALSGSRGKGEAVPDVKEYTLPDDAPDELVKFVEQLRKDATDAKAEAEKARAEAEEASKDKDEPETEADRLTKALAEVPEPVRDAITKMQAETAEQRERADKLEAAVAKAREERADAEAIAKVREFKHLAVKPEEFGPVMRKVADAMPAEAGVIEQVLTSANAVASEAFREIGKDGGADSDAMSKLRALADEIAKRDGVATAIGFAKALETAEGKALHGEYVKERSER